MRVNLLSVVSTLFIGERHAVDAMTPRIAPRSAPKRPANATDELALELKLQKARNLKQRISALIDRDEAFYQRFESLCEDIE